MTRVSFAGIANFPPFDLEGEFLNVIIDTPRDSRNKYAFDRENELFKLAGILPVGHSFPYDFGFIPNTLGEDGDELDVLVLMEEPGIVGCWVECRLIGGIQAYQTERDGKTERNDRFIAVAKKSMVYKEIVLLADLNDTLLEQIEHFFVSYNDIKGKEFKIERRMNRDESAALIRKSHSLKEKHK